MKITLIGCGWYGTPLALALKDEGHEVCVTVRRPEVQEELIEKGLRAHLLDFPQIPDPKILNTEIIILNLPPMEGLGGWIRSWTWAHAKPWMIFISSTSGKLLQDEEEIQKQFDEWTILRFGGLIGGGRHPGKQLSGRRNLPGRLWPVNLLHQDDAVGFTQALVKFGVLKETIEVVSEEHHSREIFYTEYAQRMGIPLPHFDHQDQSTKFPLSGARAREIYDFKWPTMLGKSL